MSDNLKNPAALSKQTNSLSVSDRAMTAASTGMSSLFDLRSGLAVDLADWYGAVIEHFDQTEWKRPGVGPVSLRRISVDARVYREARRRPIAEEQNSPRQSSPPPINTELSRINEEPLRQNRPELVLWKDEIPLIRHAVILGAPGAGKSFLAAAMMVQTAAEELKRLTDRQIDLESANLPVFLKLEDLANAAAGGPSEDTVIDLLRQYLPVSPVLADWIKRRLFTRRCLWILDGLDQVGGEAGVKRVDDWLARIEGSQCRSVVTCRTQSFTAQRAPGRSFVQYDLAPFESSGIRRFVEKWYGAGDARGGHLLSILRTNPSLEDSCRTPLVATLACLVNEDRNQPLPQNTRRVDLYEKIIRRFQDEEGRSGLDDIEREAEFLQIRRLAWNLFSARPESNQFTGAELLSAVPKDVRQAADWVKRLMKCRVLVKGGVVIADGAPQYSFIHRTVLEFLAAKYMEDIVDKQGWERAEVEITETVRPPAVAKGVRSPRKTTGFKRVMLRRVLVCKSWDPSWSEALVFLAGLLGKEATPLVDLLSEEPVDIARFRKMLGLRCLAEIPRSEREKRQSDDLSSNIFYFLIWNKQQHSPELVADYAECWRLLPEIDGDVTGGNLMDRLMKGVLEGDKESIEQVREMRGAAARCPRVVPTLLRAIKQGPSERTRALSALIFCGPGPDRSLTPPEEVLTCLKSDDDASVRELAAEALGAFGADHHRKAISALLHCFYHDPDLYVSMAALRTLGEFRSEAVRDPEVMAAITESLRDDTFRLSAMQALAEIINRTDTPATVIPSILYAMQRDEDGVIRATAAQLLEEIGWLAAQHEEVIPSLWEMMRNDPEDLARSAALSALGKLGRYVGLPGQVIESIVEKVLSGEPEEQSAATYALEPLGERVASLGYVKPLVRALRFGTTQQQRRNAAEAMQRIGGIAAVHEITLISDLLHTISNDTDVWVRVATVDALAGMHVGTARLEEVVSTLARVVEEDTDFRARDAAVRALLVMSDDTKYNSVITAVTVKYLKSCPRRHPARLGDGSDHLGPMAGKFCRLKWSVAEFLFERPGLLLQIARLLATRWWAPPAEVVLFKVGLRIFDDTQVISVQDLAKI